MKSLLDIQKDIREMEQTSRELSERLAEISRDVQVLRESDDDREMDYELIRTLAANMPFTTHSLSNLMDGYSCKIYIELLLCILRLDNCDVVEKMIFVQWILEKSRVDITLRDAYTESLTLEKEIFSEAARLWDKDHKLYFLVDALLVSHFTGSANAETTEYIAHLCTILGLNEYEVSACTYIAKCVLCQRVAWVDQRKAVVILLWFDKFQYYLRECDRDELLDRFCSCFSEEDRNKILEKRRDVCIEIPDEKLCDKKSDSFKWKVKPGAYVEKGQSIATCKVGSGEIHGWERTGSREMTKKAASSGYLFQFRNDHITYGVISVESDDKDSIKAWVKERRRK